MLIVEMATDAPQNKSTSDELNMDTDWHFERAWVNVLVAIYANNIL